MRFYILILLLWLHMPVYAANDTLRIYFIQGAYTLSAEAKEKIDSMMYYDLLLPGKKIGIVGYADYVGGKTSNLALSEKRAKHVQEYLLSSGIRAEDIQVVLGNGEINRDIQNSTKGYAEDRRVDIIRGGIPEQPKQIKTVQIDLSKVGKNGLLPLNNIYFKPASHIPVDASYAELKKLYTILHENPKLKINIEGHICCIQHGATDAYDIDAEDFNLSTNRAKFVYDYLIRRGIAASRLSYKGFGKQRPLIMHEKTPEDENKNRRIEIRISDK